MLLRLLRPFFRFSSARDAYVLRVGGGQRGPVLVDKHTAPVILSEPVRAPTGRFQRADGADVADGLLEPHSTQTRQH